MTRTLTAAALLALAAPALADERKFTYSYEAQTLPEGSLEFEQWATLHARKAAGVYRKLVLRSEAEYGLTDRLTTAFYVNAEYLASRGVPGLDNEHEVEFEGVSSEWKYRLTDRSIDPVGLLLYGEISAGDDEVELEGKLVLNRIIGDFHFAYNFVLEVEWEKEEENGEEEWEREYVLQHTFGVSYAASPTFAFGFEAVAEREFEGNFGEGDHTVYFAGPNVHAAVGEWWFTLTALRQVDVSGSRDLDLDGHEQYQFRLIVGVGF